MPHVPKLKKFVVCGTYEEFLQYELEYTANPNNPPTDLVFVMNYQTLKMFHPVDSELVLFGNFDENPVFQDILGRGMLRTYLQYLDLPYLNCAYDAEGRPLSIY